MRSSRKGLGQFRLPTERNWSKQHPKIRTPRPLVDRFNLGNLHPNKEWWRERRIAPATFMGFPDVTKAEVRGGSLYTEQMDAPTLAVIVDKCVSEGILNPEFWSKFSWRTQQLCPKLSEIEAAYLFRSFSRVDWFDSHLLLSLWGRIDWLLPRFTLGDISVVVEAFENPRFKNERFERRVLNHMMLLSEVRDDWTPDELCRAAKAVGLSNSGELGVKILEKIASKISNSDLSLVPVDKLGYLLHALAELQPGGYSEAAFAVTRDLVESGKLMNKSREKIGEEAVLIISSLLRLGMGEVSKQLVTDLSVDYYDSIFKLSHESLTRALLHFSNSDLVNSSLPTDHTSVLLRRIGRECHKFSKKLALDVFPSLVVVPVDSEVKAEAVAECAARIMTLGVDNVDPSVLEKVHAALEMIPDHKSEDLKSLSKIVRSARLQ